MKTAWESLRHLGAATAPVNRQDGAPNDAQAQALQRAAWLRAMEQSQFASWLDHAALPARQGGAAAAPQLFSAAPAAVWPPADAAAAAAQGGAASSAMADEPAAGAVPGGAARQAGAAGSDGTHAATAGDGRSGVGDAGSSGAAAPAGARPAQAAQSQAPHGPAPDVGHDLAYDPAHDLAYDSAHDLAHDSGHDLAHQALLSAIAAAVHKIAPAPGVEGGLSGPSAAAPPPAAAAGWFGGSSAGLAGVPDGVVVEETAVEPAPLAQAEETAAAKAAAAASDDHAPLRLHAEWLEHGVRIWIGADQTLNLDAHGLAQLSEQLQLYCRQQGAPLLALVCNGKRVALEAPGPDSAPPPAPFDAAAAKPAPARHSAIFYPYFHQEQS